MSFPFDASTYRTCSRRRVVFARGGMVCSSQPLAAQAGLDVLRRGGNAVDAAIATAAALTVVEPTSNGVGGDAFAQIWMDGRLYGLNSSGPACALADADYLRSHFGAVPEEGWYSVNVPGIPAAWAEASRKFGRLPFPELFTSAISYAESGYPVAPVVAELWREDFRRFHPLRNEQVFKPWFENFAPEGAPPKAGETVLLPHLAGTLRELAASGCESFYRGELAQKIDDWSRRSGGWLRADDLAAFRPEWVEPIGVDYRGYRVWELPPNGHGLVVLMTLGILSGFDRLDGGVESVHRAIEAMKLAYADGKRYIADRRYMPCSAEQLLDAGYLESRRALIGRSALEPMPGSPDCGGTVYFCTADRDGNMVSWIQSNYNGFGAGVVVPGGGAARGGGGADRGQAAGTSPAAQFPPGTVPAGTVPGRHSFAAG